MRIAAPWISRLGRTAAGTALVASGAALPLHAQAPTAVDAAPTDRALESSVAPGDDFFAYANAGWLTASTIPDGMDRWSARDEINAVTRERIARLLDDARTAPPASSARKVADFRAAWLNVAAIEARGRAPVQAQLDSVAAINDRHALTRLLGRWMRADVDPLNSGVYESSSVLGLSVEPSIHGERTYVAFLLEGGLGLPDRDLYLGADPRAITLRTTYRDYLRTLLSFAGVDHADRRAEVVLSLETAIARTHGTRAASANDRNADSVWARADFARRAPGIDWSEFFAAAGLEKQDALVAWQPTAIAGMAALVASQPLDAWKDYLRARVVDAYAEVLPRVVAERAAALRVAATGGQLQPNARPLRALDATQAALGDVIGRMYAERYFPAEQKARVRRLVDDVTAAFAKRVERAAWMSPATRATALAKVKSLYVGVGYPDRWPDDASELVVHPDDAIGNLRRIADRDHRHALSRLSEPVDHTEWWISPQKAGAVLVFQQNTYDFSAALLQPPKFDAAASDAACYGAIGAIIGHDVSHFVDVLGAEYDVDGAMHHWWTAEDASRFSALTEPLVRQFTGYRPFPDTAVNGTLTLTENIADLAGLVSAFDAHRTALGERTKDTSYVRAQDREFFLAFARSWRAKTSDVALRAQLAGDHAPERYRVATVRNLDAWYDAFDVRPGQRLYLAPSARVQVW